MSDLSSLPTVNAALNATALVLLVVGYCQIRAGNTTLHKRCMIAAFGVSTLFLICYLTYRFAGAEKKFTGQGMIRPVYFTLLISHVVLAACVPLLAIRTMYLAFRGRTGAHRRIARVTLPIWIYVSLSGILVYVLLFQLYPPRDG